MGVFILHIRSLQAVSKVTDFSQGGSLLKILPDKILLTIPSTPHPRYSASDLLKEL